jgi:hypothetical protein
LVFVLENLLNKNTKNKTFINIPIILATIFISLPMVGFHTKDMKLDE